MYEMLNRNGQAIAFGLGALIIGIFVVLAATAGIGDLQMEQVLEATDKHGMFTFGIAATLAMVGVALVAMLGFGLFQMATDLKGSLKGIIGVGVIVLFFVIGYVMSQPILEGTPLYEVASNPDFNVTGNVSKLIDGGLYATLILLAVSLIAAVGFEIYNLFK